MKLSSIVLLQVEQHGLQPVACLGDAVGIVTACYNIVKTRTEISLWCFACPVFPKDEVFSLVWGHSHKGVSISEEA